MPKAHFLAFHIAVRGSDSELENRIAGRLRRQHNNTPRGRAIIIAAQTAQPCCLVFHHAAQVVGQPAANREDGEHLEEIGKRRRILERMCGVGVHVTTAVRAEHFDRDLRSDRTLHDSLFGRSVALP